MRVLLEPEDVNPNATGGRGGMLLLGAAYGGHEGVVKMLLGQVGANSDWRISLVKQNFPHPNRPI